MLSKREAYSGLRSFDNATTLPLRGLMALLIVIHHVGQHTDIHPVPIILSEVGAFIVAIFFFISGYGLCKSYIAKGRSYLDGFLQKRMGKLLPKFLLLTFLMIILYHFSGIIDIRVQAEKFTSGFTPLPFSWFIYAIVYVYLAFYICAKVAESPKRIGLLLTVAIVIYICVLSKGLHFPRLWYKTIIAVSLGYFVALYETRVEKFFNRKELSYSILVVLFCVSAYAYRTITAGNNVSFALTELWLLVQAFSVYVIIRSLGFAQWKWLRQAGVFSLELYLVHGIPLKTGLHFGLENWSLCLFTYALSIPLAIVLNRGYDWILTRKKALQA